MRTAGRYRDFIFIRSHSSTKSAEGEVVESYSAGTGRPCEIRYMLGGERLIALREGNENVIEIRLRYEAGLLTGKDRLENRDTSPWEVYDVESVAPDRKRTELICQCRLIT